MNVMFRQLGAHLLAVLIAGSPVALQLCEVHCQETATHSCPHEVTSDAIAKVSPVPHTCGHAEDLPTLSTSPRTTHVADAVTADLPILISLPAPRSSGTLALSSLSPPGPVPLTLRTPLRV